MSQEGRQNGWPVSEQRVYEDRLRSLALRQEGFEQRLQEFGGALSGFAEERSGQAQRLQAVDDLRAWAQTRLQEIEDMQKTMVVDLKVMSAVVDESLRNSVVRQLGSDGRHDTASAEALTEVRQDVKTLGKAMETLRERVRACVAEAAPVARLEAQGRRLFALTAAVGRWCTRLPPWLANTHGLLRVVLQEWRSTCRSEALRPRTLRLGSMPGDRSAEHAAALRELRRSLGSISGKVDKHERGLAELRDQTQVQDLHLARVDAALDAALSSKPGRDGGCGAALAGGQEPGAKELASEQGAARLADLVEVLAGQAKAVEDLEVVVRDELRASRELAEAAAASAAADPAFGGLSQQLLDQVVEQGQAIAQLRCILTDLAAAPSASSDALPPPATAVQPGAAGALPGTHQVCEELTSRMADLEEDVGSIREQFGLLVAVVRHVRDHAADALEDRVAAAMGEVRTRLAGCTASLSERVDCLRAACGPGAIGAKAAGEGGPGSQDVAEARAVAEKRTAGGPPASGGAG